jgi:hypothetical protein
MRKEETYEKCETDGACNGNLDDAHERCFSTGSAWWRWWGRTRWRRRPRWISYVQRWRIARGGSQSIHEPRRIQPQWLESRVTIIRLIRTLSLTCAVGRGLATFFAGKPLGAASVIAFSVGVLAPIH